MARSAAGWRRWFDRWEAQQESFNPSREARFSAMLDLLAATLPARFTALDLGCGTGALSVRLLRRFPAARCVAIDHDPVVLRVGEGAWGSFGGRLRWVDADLGRSGWREALARPRFDAALSTTALHWLDRGALGRFYAELARVLRRGGVFLNGDRLPYGAQQPALSRLAERVRRVRFPGRSLEDEWAAWRAWWSAAERDPELGALFPERERRQTQHPQHGDEPLAAHLRALHRAGFGLREVVWRDLENGILFARR
jgi:SAM-dependent methyltransferase